MKSLTSILLLLCLTALATEFKLPNGGQGIIYYGNINSNLTANTTFTNQINSPLKAVNFTAQFFYTGIGTNSTQVWLDQSCDLGTNWVNVYSNTFTATNSFVYIATNKFSDLRVRVSALTTNANFYFNHIAQ